MDMGVVRSALIINGNVKVQITPTYSGCPAMDVIGDDIKKALKDAGYESKVDLIQFYQELERIQLDLSI